jgi:hypothetical protein
MEDLHVEVLTKTPCGPSTTKAWSLATSAFRLPTSFGAPEPWPRRGPVESGRRATGKGASSFNPTARRRIIPTSLLSAISLS